MRKQLGFTLTELLVSMAIFVLIIGAIVGLFGVSMRAFVSGHAQAGAYSEARDVMNDLKTTLRYATKDTDTATNIKFTKGANGTELYYTGEKVKDLPSGINKSTNETFERTIEWVDGNHKQILITKVDNGVETKVIFPKGERNSAFNASEFLKVYNKVISGDSSVSSASDTDSPFPIVEAKFEDGKMYNIILPIKYASMGIDKVDVLQSRVNTMDLPVPKGTGDSISISDALAKAASEALADPKSLLGSTDDQKKNDKIVSQIDSGSLKQQNQDKGVFGATNTINSYLSDAGVINDIGRRTWKIVPLDKNFTSTRQRDKIVYWAIYVAKNVEDDYEYVKDGKIVSSGTSGATLTKGYYADMGNDAVFKNMAENAGRYIIREGWAFLVYRTLYNSDGTLYNNKDSVLGYALATPDTAAATNTTIKYSTWQDTYSALSVSSKKGYIDYGKGGNNGDEYTKATATDAGMIYSYPPYTKK